MESANGRLAGDGETASRPIRSTTGLGGTGTTLPGPHGRHSTVSTAAGPWRERWRVERARPAPGTLRRTAARGARTLDARHGRCAGARGHVGRLRAVHRNTATGGRRSGVREPPRRTCCVRDARSCCGPALGARRGIIAERLDERHRYTGHVRALTVQIGVPALDLVVAVLGPGHDSALRPPPATTTICYVDVLRPPERIERSVGLALAGRPQHRVRARPHRRRRIAPMLARIRVIPDAPSAAPSIAERSAGLARASRAHPRVAARHAGRQLLARHARDAHARTPTPRDRSHSRASTRWTSESRPPDVRVALLGALADVRRQTRGAGARRHAQPRRLVRAPHAERAAPRRDHARAHRHAPLALEALNNGLRSRSEAVRATW